MEISDREIRNKKLRKRRGVSPVIADTPPKKSNSMQNGEKKRSEKTKTVKGEVLRTSNKDETSEKTEEPRKKKRSTEKSNKSGKSEKTKKTSSKKGNKEVSTPGEQLSPLKITEWPSYTKHTILNRIKRKEILDAR